jgi:hypothetical protein
MSGKVRFLRFRHKDDMFFVLLGLVATESVNGDNIMTFGLLQNNGQISKEFQLIAPPTPRKLNLVVFSLAVADDNDSSP